MIRKDVEKGRAKTKLLKFSAWCGEIGERREREREMAKALIPSPPSTPHDDNYNPQDNLNPLPPSLPTPARISPKHKNDAAARLAPGDPAHSLAPYSKGYQQTKKISKGFTTLPPGFFPTQDHLMTAARPPARPPARSLPRPDKGVGTNSKEREIDMGYDMRAQKRG